MLLERARELFFENIQGKATKCPCCERTGKVYPLTLNTTRIKSLIWLHKAAMFQEGGWVDVPNEAPKELLRTNQLSSLKHWGLIEAATNEDRKKKASGIWRITETGDHFLKGFLSIECKVWIWNDGCIKMDGGFVYISDVDCHFDYEATMADKFKDTK